MGDDFLFWGLGLVAAALLLIVVEVFVPSAGLISLTATGCAIAGVYCLFKVSVGWGITKGGEAPEGTLPEVQSNKGWVRDPQRFPVRISLRREANGPLEELPLRNGAQANVLILTDADSWLNPIGRAWLRVVSWLRYIY